MGKSNLIVFTPGFRRVFKLRLNAVAVVCLSLVSCLAVALSIPYVSLMTSGNNEYLYRLVVENRTRLTEKQTMESQVNQLNARAKALAQETLRIAGELQEQEEAGN